VNRTGYAAAALAATLLAAGCVSPSRTDRDYRRKAANTAEAVASSVNTVKLGADAARDGKVFGPYLSRLVAEAEEDALAAQQAFDSVQPPSATDDTVHDHLDELLTDALDLLREARLAVRRGELAHVASLSDKLTEAADALDAFEADPS
jgi:hypothetical protein